MRFFSELSLLATSRSARSVFLTALAVLSWGTGMVENAVMGDLAVTTGLTDIATAETAPAGTAAATPDKASTSTEDGVQKMINVIMEAIMMLFLPATIIAGWLLSPDWTFGEIFGLRPILHQLWVLISNVVYVIFAFLLVGIAFMNIFWAGGDQYAIKKALPRFVVGILIVPFTWFAVSAILSISNILTASVLRLPADILQNVKGADNGEFTFDMPKKCVLNFDKLQTSGGTTAAKWAATSSSPPAGKIFDCGDAKAVTSMTFRDILASDKGAYGILNVYAYGIFKVQDLKKIDSLNLKSVGSVLDIIISTGIWVLFLFIFALLVLALTFALFTRAMYMWLIAVFSPLFGLFYFMEGKGKFAEEYGKKIGFASFVSLAMVPVYAAAALGFGLLFLKMVESAPIIAENSSFFSDATGNESTTTFKMGGKEKFVEIEVQGLPTGITEGAAKTGNIAGKGVALAGSAIGKIIVDVLGLVVLWLAVMAALNSSEITKQAVSPISEFGASMGKLIKSLPQHTPIPLPGGHKMSMTGLASMGSQIEGSIRSAAQQQWSEIGGKISSKLVNGLNPQTQAIRDLQIKAGGTTNPSEIADITKRALVATGAENTAKLAGDNFKRNQFVSVLESFKPDAFIDQKKASEVIGKMKNESDPAKFTELFKEFNHQLKTRVKEGLSDVDTQWELDAILKTNTWKTEGNKITIGVNGTTPEITVQGKSANLKSAPWKDASGKATEWQITQADFDGLASQLGILPKTPANDAAKEKLKKDLKDSGIVIV